MKYLKAIHKLRNKYLGGSKQKYSHHVNKLKQYEFRAPMGYMRKDDELVS